jgi:toxin ParE1/3/4
VVLRVSPQAHAALDDIWFYLARESGSVDVADRQVEAIAGRFPLLEQWPLVGRARDDLCAGLCSYPVGRYLIIYRIEGADVLVLHIIHASRDLDAVLRCSDP